jgi:hypothetical protein
MNGLTKVVLNAVDIMEDDKEEMVYPAYIAGCRPCATTGHRYKAFNDEEIALIVTEED